MEDLDKSALERIVKGCIKGDRNSQQILYERYYSKMMGICYRYAKDPDEAKDLLHDGFMKIFRSLHKYNFSGSLEGWMRRLMINSAIDHYRKYKNVFSISETNIEEQITEQDQGDENIYSSFNTQMIMEAVQNLSTAYRTVFSLYAIEGYSHKEIADNLGISVNTSKSQYSRARSYLQKILANAETSWTSER